jgi:hypothetical protein
MDTKLRHILELALRADTGDGESSAALAAARRLVAKHGIELLGAQAPEQVVYRDKVVYHKPNHSHARELTMQFPATFHHAMLERIFLDANALECDIKLISCTSRTQDVMSGTVIKFKVMGTQAGVDTYNSNMNSYVDQMKRKTGYSGPQSSTPDPQARSQTSNKAKGWFSKLFSRS